jgi:inositol-1,3,4-trisphosphate 5/6-kinase/inositol-tetrakisphosphate 1-kinase
VIDINYFPGVDKIPDFEHVFVDFLRSAVTGEGERDGHAGLCQLSQGRIHNIGVGGGSALPSPVPGCEQHQELPLCVT